jgi:hypothetical protein
MPHLIALKFSEEEITQIMDLAACNYSPEKIAIQLDVDKPSFLQMWYDKSSDVRNAYEAGKLKATFMIINKQRELAESGNITAAQIFLKESDKIEKASIRDRILYQGTDAD